MKRSVLSNVNINNFDFLRIVFATTVAIAHFIELSQIEILQPLQGLFNTPLAISGFFVISGFLVAKSFENSSNTKSHFDLSFTLSTYSGRILGLFLTSHHSISPNHSYRLTYKISFPSQDILLSNVLSRPEISVPIMVTDTTPIIIPSAVRIDLVLFTKWKRVFLLMI